MVRNSSAILANLAILAIFALALPLQAQSVQDFSLPPSSPAEEPEVQGPADESGVVPVGPRIITEEDDTRPAETVEAGGPTIDAEQLPSEDVPEAPANQPAPVSVNPQNVARPQQAPAPDQQAAEAIPEPAGAAGSQIDTEAGAAALPPFVPADDLQFESSTEAEAYPQWVWLTAGGTFLLLLILAGVLFRRRSRAQEVPQIEPPIVAGQGDQAGVTASNAKVEANVEVIGLSRSLMNLMLNCRISISNRSPRAVRDLVICADLTSAHRNQPFDRQLAMADTALPKRAEINRIGPHQSFGEQLSLQIPVAELNGFTQGEAALCIPLLRLRVDGSAIEAHTRTFAIGLTNGNTLAPLQPVPLHVPPGSYNGARARPLD